jgi:hypothetical protein
MYRRKASLDHRPESMMVNTGTLAKYIAMAVDDRKEWRPISLAGNLLDEIAEKLESDQ